MWIFVETGHFDPRSPVLTTIVLWAHFPLIGFAIGYLTAFEVSLTKVCLKQVALRYGLFIVALAGIGIVVALYAAAHDS